MKISEILKQDKVTLSFEVFPPKKIDDYSKVEAAAKKIASLHPDFMSITYGAGGGTSQYTVDLARDLYQKSHPNPKAVSSILINIHLRSYNPFL